MTIFLGVQWSLKWEDIQLQTPESLVTDRFDEEKEKRGVPVMVQWKQGWLVYMRTQFWYLACSVGWGSGVVDHSSDPALLWLLLWLRPVSTGPIQSLAWEPPYTSITSTGEALKKKKKKEEEIAKKVKRDVTEEKENKESVAFLRPSQKWILRLNQSVVSNSAAKRNKMNPELILQCACDLKDSFVQQCFRHLFRVSLRENKQRWSGSSKYWRSLEELYVKTQQSF